MRATIYRRPVVCLCDEPDLGPNWCRVHGAGEGCMVCGHEFKDGERQYRAPYYEVFSDEKWTCPHYMEPGGDEVWVTLCKACSDKQGDDDDRYA